MARRVLLVICAAAMFLFFAYPFWHMFRPVGKLLGFIGIVMFVFSMMLTLAGYILLIEVWMESRFRKRAKSKLHFTLGESVFSEGDGNEKIAAEESTDKE